MNERNVEYLKDNLKYMGFGDQLNSEMEKNIRLAVPEFVLKISSEFNRAKLEGTLHFKRSENTDMYFFNRWEAALKNDIGRTEHTFYLNNGRGITYKEGYNLLSGRAVHTELANKEGQKYNAWVQLDFTDKEANGNYKLKQYHENYGYDLAATLQKFPIKELADEVKKDRLYMSLQKGNLQSVTMDRNDREEKMYVAANPQFKSLHVYDTGMNKVQVQSLLQGVQQKNEMSNGKETSLQAEQKKTVSQKGGDEAEEPEGPKQKSRRKQSAR